MSNLGKCVRCNKTCYALEGLRVGAFGKEQAFHKSCFKCHNEGCNWQLTLSNYKFFEEHVYCPNHCPVTGQSNKKDGEYFKVHGATSADALFIAKPLSAPKAHEPVNEQIRGPKQVCSKCGTQALTGQFCSACGERV